MKKILFTIPLLIMLTMSCFMSQKHTDMAEETTMVEMKDPVEHGRYLTTIMACTTAIRQRYLESMDI